MNNEFILAKNPDGTRHPRAGILTSIMQCKSVNSNSAGTLQETRHLLGRGFKRVLFPRNPRKKMTSFAGPPGA